MSLVPGKIKNRPLFARRKACTEAILQGDFASVALRGNLIQALGGLRIPVLPEGTTLESHVGRNWCAYFHCMVRIVELTELRGGKISNIFPRDNGYIPGHYRFDTTALVKLFQPELPAYRGKA